MPKFKCVIVSTFSNIGPVPTAMRKLGFSYMYAIPRPICDSWEFYGCEIAKLKKNRLPTWARSAGFKRDVKPIGFDDDMFANYLKWVGENFNK